MVSLGHTKITLFSPLKIHVFPCSCLLGASSRLPESLFTVPVWALIFHSDPFCCSEPSHRTKHAGQGQSRCPLSMHLHLKLHYSVAPICFILQIVFWWGKETVKLTQRHVRIYEMTYRGSCSPLTTTHISYAAASHHSVAPSVSE